MGTYLSTPVTEKNDESGENLVAINNPVPCVWGVVDMQGWRKGMEDAHVAQTDVEIPNNSSSYKDNPKAKKRKEVPYDAKVFGVFDGHGGPEVARFCQLYFVSVLQQQPSWKRLSSSCRRFTPDGDTDSDDSDDNDDDGNNNNNDLSVENTPIGLSLRSAFHALDRMIDDPNRRQEIIQLRSKKPDLGERRDADYIPPELNVHFSVHNTKNANNDVDVADETCKQLNDNNNSTDENDNAASAQDGAAAAPIATNTTDDDEDPAVAGNNNNAPTSTTTSTEQGAQPGEGGEAVGADSNDGIRLSNTPPSSSGGEGSSNPDTATSGVVSDESREETEESSSPSSGDKSTSDTETYTAEATTTSAAQSDNTDNDDKSKSSSGSTEEPEAAAEVVDDSIPSSEHSSDDDDDDEEDADSQEAVGKEEAAEEREEITDSPPQPDDHHVEPQQAEEQESSNRVVSAMFKKLLTLSSQTGSVVVQMGSRPFLSSIGQHANADSSTNNSDNPGPGQQQQNTDSGAAASSSKESQDATSPESATALLSEPPTATNPATTADGSSLNPLPTVVQNGRMICNLPDHPIHAGATAIVAVVVGRTLTVANAGDSRAVLCRAGVAWPLSFDHKPLQERELSRIQSAGGFVNQFGRVNGNLNLSRSIGDLKYKQVQGIPPAEQMITAEPDIVQLTLGSEDEFIILGCDGIWDCLSNDKAVEYVRSRIDSKKPTEIGAEMLDEIISEDPRATQGIGGDNMTIMIIDLMPQQRSYRATADPSPEES